jgi:hypothetical protein
MRMRWCDLLFAHWAVDPRTIRQMLPSGLELDQYKGRAYVGVVPFRMEDVAPRGLPAPPFLSAFPELNVRTYVRHHGRSGVWFLSLDATNPIAVAGARRAFHLPYVRADMQVRDLGTEIEYESIRRCPSAPAASFRARYGPTGSVERASIGSFERWMSARERLFAVDGDGRIHRTEVRHAAWPLQPAWAEIDATAMFGAHGLRPPDGEPHLRFARRLDVKAWWPRPS